MVVSVKTYKLEKHDILKKRMCATCINGKYGTMPVTRAKRLYKLKEEDLAGLRVAVKLNPVNHLYKHMRLFLCSDLDRAAERKRLLPKPKRAPCKVKSASSKPVQEPSGDGIGGGTCNALHKLTSLHQLHADCITRLPCSLPNLQIDVQAPSQTEEVQPLTPAQPVLPELGVPLTKVQQDNLRNMCIIADTLAPGICPIATLAAHALTRMDPMSLVELQQFAAVVLRYRQQQQLSQ
jgi:hypothetical protein